MNIKVYGPGDIEVVTEHTAYAIRPCNWDPTYVWLGEMGKPSQRFSTLAAAVNALPDDVADAIRAQM